MIVDCLYHFGNEHLHIIGPLHAPLDDLLVVGVDAGVVLDHTHVGDEAAGEHLHPAVVCHKRLRDGAHAHRVHSCMGWMRICCMLNIFPSLPSSLRNLSSATVS